jgi:uncharacterized membrane protein
MNEINTDVINDERLNSLKKTAVIVYICQMLTVLLAGLPLVISVLINFSKKEAVKGTWLQSHFDWQVITACVALTGITLSALAFPFQVGWLILVVTLLFLVYRIAIGWIALKANKPVVENLFKFR